MFIVVMENVMKKYTAKYGTFSEQLEAKRVAMQSETPIDKGQKAYVNCAACHGAKGEGGIGPKLVGSTSIVAMLTQYKNGETRGAQSALYVGTSSCTNNARYGESAGIYWNI